MKLRLSALSQYDDQYDAPTPSCLRKHLDIVLVPNMEEKYECVYRQEYVKTDYITANMEEEPSPSSCMSQRCSCTLQYPPKTFSVQVKELRSLCAWERVWTEFRLGTK